MSFMDGLFAPILPPLGAGAVSLGALGGGGSPPIYGAATKSWPEMLTRQVVWFGYLAWFGSPLYM